MSCLDRFLEIVRKLLLIGDSGVEKSCLLLRLWYLIAKLVSGVFVVDEILAWAGLERAIILSCLLCVSYV